MENRKIIGIFAIVLIVSSTAKLFGLSLQPLLEAYEKVGTTMMAWVAPEIFSGVYPAYIKTLVVCIPILFAISFTLSITRMIIMSRKSTPRGSPLP